MFFFLVLFFRDPMIRSDDPVRWSDPDFIDSGHNLRFLHFVDMQLDFSSQQF